MAKQGDKATKTQGPMLRIIVRAYDNKVIDAATKKIVDIAERFNAAVKGPVPLPTKIKKYSVNRSTFVKKTSQEQFEKREHKRLVDILNPNAKTMDALMNLDLPKGVHLEVNSK